jgi:hypothetical protein
MDIDTGAQQEDLHYLVARFNGKEFLQVWGGDV